MERADVALVRDIAIIVLSIAGTGFAIIAVALFWTLNRKLAPIFTSIRTITKNGAEASEVIAQQVVAPLAQAVGLIALAGEVIKGFLGISKKKEDHNEYQQG